MDEVAGGHDEGEFGDFLGREIPLEGWTLDKFVRADHAAKVFSNFYLLPGWGAGAFRLIDALELVLLLAFLAGFKNRLAYGAVLGLHAISTFSSYMSRRLVQGGEPIHDD